VGCFLVGPGTTLPRLDIGREDSLLSLLSLDFISSEWAQLLVCSPVIRRVHLLLVQELLRLFVFAVVARTVPRVPVCW